MNYSSINLPNASCRSLMFTCVECNLVIERPNAQYSLLNLLLCHLRHVADNFDIIPRRINHKRPVVIRMILWPQPRRPIILASRRKSSLVELINHFPVCCEGTSLATR